MFFSIKNFFNKRPAFISQLISFFTTVTTIIAYMSLFRVISFFLILILEKHFFASTVYLPVFTVKFLKVIFSTLIYRKIIRLVFFKKVAVDLFSVNTYKNNNKSQLNTNYTELLNNTVYIFDLLELSSILTTTFVLLVIFKYFNFYSFLVFLNQYRPLRTEDIDLSLDLIGDYGNWAQVTLYLIKGLIKPLGYLLLMLTPLGFLYYYFYSSRNKILKTKLLDTVTQYNLKAELTKNNGYFEAISKSCSEKFELFLKTIIEYKRDLTELGHYFLIGLILSLEAYQNINPALLELMCSFCSIFGRVYVQIPEICFSIVDFFNIVSVKTTINEEFQPLPKVNSLKLEQIGFAYVNKERRPHIIIKDLNQEIKNKFGFVINGYSGSGKTTLAKIIKGALKPHTGRILVNEQPCTPESLMKSVYYLDQTVNFYENLTIRENLNLGGNNHSDNALVLYLAKVNLEHLSLDELLKNSKISGGQQKRLSFARMLADLNDNHRILILDEVLSNLDLKNVQLLINLANKLNNRFIIWIIHNKATIKNLQDIGYDVIDMDGTSILEKIKSYELKLADKAEEITTSDEEVKTQN